MSKCQFVPLLVLSGRGTFVIALHSAHTLATALTSMDSPDPDLLQLAQLAMQHKCMLATAESCTGGMIAAAFTDLAGSSSWFDRSFITYSNNAKQQMLGVTDEVLVAHGAVSEATVIQMAEGAVARSDANIAVAVSGVAGPSGGSAEKPVGTVWIACAVDGAAVDTEHHLFNGDRHSVRRHTVEQSVRLLIRCIKGAMS